MVASARPSGILRASRILSAGSTPVALALLLQITAFFLFGNGKMRNDADTQRQSLLLALAHDVQPLYKHHPSLILARWLPKSLIFLAVRGPACQLTTAVRDVLERQSSR